MNKILAPSLLVFSLLIIVALLLNFHFWNLPIISDEGGYAYVAKFWNTNYRLYRDIILDRPQGVILLYKFFLFFSNSAIGFRIFATISQIVCAFLVFLIARQRLNFHSAITSGLIYLFFAPSPRIEGFTANAEIFTLPLILYSTYLALNQKWALSSFLAALAFIVKPIGLSALAFIFIWSFTNIKTTKKFFIINAKNFLIFVFPLIPFVLHAYFTSQGTNNYLWIFLSKSSADSIFHPSLNMIVSFLENSMFTSPAWLPLLALSLLAIPQLNQVYQKFFIFFTFTSFLGLMIGGNWYYHYYIQLMPSLAIFSGAGLFILFSNLKHSRKHLTSLLALIILCFGLIDLFQFYLMPAHEISWNLYHRLAYTMEKPIVQYIQNSTQVNDQIYIAYSDPQLYYLSNRQASHSHLYWTHFINSPRIRQELIDQFNQKKPKLIIETFSPQIKYQFPELNQSLTQNYHFKESLRADLSLKPFYLRPSQLNSTQCDQNYYPIDLGYQLCVNIYERI